MRLAVAIVLMSACGTQPMPPSSQTSPDAGEPAAGDAGTDGAALSICEQATQHSDLAWIQSNVFSASCALSNCHTSTNQAGGLVLEAGMAHDNLVNRPSTQHTDWMRVLATEPAQSYLLVAIGGADGPDRGTMPWAMPPLCQEKIDAIQRWIAGGANP
jgi:hypothetical protein